MAPSNQELRETRIYSGQGKEDNRTHFQRDRDRVLYTPAFRRLGGVAQVVHVNAERGYHNRLTHSLKVSQVGRRLAENLIETTDSKSVEMAGGLDADVVETACLAHDLGHPPFGHPAEEAIQNKLDVVDSFEGNPQSFRIVNNVAIREESYMEAEGHQGLDLTLASLNAMLKYPWRRSTAGKKAEKWGYYSTEKEEFNRVRDLRTPGSDDSSMSLEAKIMDWADDLTYAIHDVVDFYKAGLIPLDELVSDANERERFLDKFETNHSNIPSECDGTEFLDTFLPNMATVGQSESGSKEVHHIDTPFNDSSGERAGITFMTSELVGRYLGVQGDKDTVSIDPSIDGGLDISPKLKCEIDLLQFLSEHYVFENSALVAQQQGHKKIVKELFDVLLDATESNADTRGILPTPFDEKVNLIHENNLGYDSVGTDTLRARIVADIIASMTEQQAMELYERVAGSSPGLVTDRIV